MSSSPARSAAYLAFVRDQPCAVCSTPHEVQAHHHGRGTGGMGIKTCDLHTAPLCTVHHGEWHTQGKFKSHGLDRAESQALLWRAIAETLRRAILAGQFSAVDTIPV